MVTSSIIITTTIATPKDFFFFKKKAEGEELDKTTLTLVYSNNFRVAENFKCFSSHVPYITTNYKRSLHNQMVKILSFTSKLLISVPLFQSEPMDIYICSF